jgi:hypothetical protein
MEEPQSRPQSHGGRRVAASTTRRRPDNTMDMNMAEPTLRRRVALSMDKAEFQASQVPETANAPDTLPTKRM